MAGEAGVTKYISVKSLINVLRRLDPDSLITVNQVGNLAVHRGDDPHRTWEGMLGYINVLTEEYRHQPVCTEEEWETVRDMPVHFE